MTLTSGVGRRNPRAPSVWQNGRTRRGGDGGDGWREDEKLCEASRNVLIGASDQEG